MKMLSGLMSRCTTPLLCATSSTSRTTSATDQEIALAERHPAVAPPLERLAREQLHHEVRRAAVRPPHDDVVVEHLDHARVVDTVGRVPLAQEAAADILVPCEEVMEHLHGGARAVPVHARVDRAHPTDAEQALELPLVVEGVADAGACPAKRRRLVARLIHLPLRPFAGGARVRTSGEPLSLTWHHATATTLGTVRKVHRTGDAHAAPAARVEA